MQRDTIEVFVLGIVKEQSWLVRPAFVVMRLATLILSFPLSQGLINRLRTGVSQAPAVPVSMATYDAIQIQVDRYKGVSLMFAIRRPSSLERPADYRIVVASESPLPRSFGTEIVDMLRKQMTEDITG